MGRKVRLEGETSQIETLSILRRLVFVSLQTLFVGDQHIQATLRTRR